MAQNSKSKSQGATEYLLNYGWAIILIAAIGVSMYYLGIFNLSSQSTLVKASGFSKIKPLEPSIILTPSCEFTGIFVNGAGSVVNISKIEIYNVVDKKNCDTSKGTGLFDPGDAIEVKAENCCSQDHKPEEQYNLKINISYTSQIAGVRFDTLDQGVIYGAYSKGYKLPKCEEQGGFCCAPPFNTCKPGKMLSASDCSPCCQGPGNSNCDKLTTTTTSTTTTSVTTTTTTSTTTSTITTTKMSTTTTTSSTTTTTTSTTTTTIPCYTYDSCNDCVSHSCVWNIRIVHVPPPEGPEIIEWCAESCLGLATWCAPPNSCGGFITTTTTTTTSTTTVTTTTTTKTTTTTTSTTSTTTTVKTLCWSSSYLYRTAANMYKFCKCTTNTYGYSGYTNAGYTSGRRYLDTGNNLNWGTTSITSYMVSQVRCPNGAWYTTSQNYYYPP
ncbi:MAG: hypothetical protein QW802_00290 [Candidatus Altiarchaeota archaeon]